MSVSTLRLLGAAIGAILVVAGVAIVVLSEKLSALESRLRKARPWTKVTRWSGSHKGVIAWRFVGLLLILCGVYEFNSFIRLW